MLPPTTLSGGEGLWGKINISSSPPEHLQLRVRNSYGMPEHFPTHHSCVQLLPAFPTHKSSLPLQALGTGEDGSARMCTPGTSLSSPPFAADQVPFAGNSIPANHPLVPDPAVAGKCLRHLFNPQIVGKGNRTRRDGRVDEDREKPAGLLPTLRGTWMGVGCSQLACFLRCCSWGHDPRTHEPPVGPMTDAPWG